MQSGQKEMFSLRLQSLTDSLYLSMSRKRYLDLIYGHSAHFRKIKSGAKILQFFGIYKDLCLKIKFI